MLLRRKLILALAVVLVAGPVGVTVGYGVYVRSRFYRESLEAELTAFFDMPAVLGRVEPRSLSSQAFYDVEVWLPGRRDRVFACEQAVWSEVVEDGVVRNELSIRNGRLTLGSEQWQLEDFNRVLHSSLSHDFAKLELRRIRLDNIDLAMVRRDLRLVVAGADGQVEFERPDEGRATLSARSLNGRRVEQGIRLVARFNPLAGLTLHDVTLDVPWIDAAALGIDAMLQTTITEGQFRGQITYRERDAAWELQLAGEVRNIRLAEFTQRVPGGPLAGHVDLSIDDLLVVGGMPRRLVFRGHLREVDLAPLAALLGQPQIEGTGDLTVESAHIEHGRVVQLSVRGSVEGPSLEDVSAKLGRGTITGRLSLAVNSLHVVDNEILAADIDVIAVPPPGGVGTMDRQLILEALAVAGWKLPPFLARGLPEQVPYVKLGAKLLVDDGRLRLLGTHGEHNDTILTLRLFGRDVAVFKQPNTSIELKPLLDELERRAEDLTFDDLRRWWEARRDRPDP